MDLGAIEVESGDYCRPSSATKDKSYKCAECDQRVILRKGSIRRPHFAHYSKRECSYYEHPNESQLHKDAKFRMAEILKQKSPISIEWACGNSNCRGSSGNSNDIVYKHGDEVVIEYRDPSGKYIADVAVINEGKPRLIFEIKNTHATTTARPEPWFEFEAKEFYEDYNLDTTSYAFSCIRRSSMRECLGCATLKEPWIDNIPRLDRNFDPHKAWEQSHPCVICKRKLYSAIFCRGYRQLCKICIESDYDELKRLYDLNLKGKCMFI